MQPLEQVGLKRPSQAVTGQPVARAARRLVDSSTAATTVGTPAASAKASTISSVRTCGPRRPASRRRWPHCIRWATDVTSAISRALTAFLALTRSAIAEVSSGTPRRAGPRW